MFMKNAAQMRQELPLLEVRSPFIVKSLDVIGYDAASVGWQDLLLPPELLTAVSSDASFPFLSANLRTADTGEAAFPPYEIKEFDGFKVGIFGLVSNKMPAGIHRGIVRHTVLDPIEAARQAVRELRKSCQLVIALTSQGLEDDVVLARSVPGIDLILGGLSHRVLYQARVEGDSIIVQTGTKGMRIGHLDLEFDPARTGRWTPRKSAGENSARVFSWKPVSLAKSIKDHPAIVTLLEEYRNILREKKVAAKMSPPALAEPSAYVGVAVCRKCHTVEAAMWHQSPHAKAFATLVAKRQDANPDCLICHVTAFGKKGGYVPGRIAPDLRGVQCEACHGAGRQHRKPGRIELKVSEATCRSCHNRDNSPSFQYEKYLKKLGPHAAKYFRRR
jgi:hypothetical protein